MSLSALSYIYIITKIISGIFYQFALSPFEKKKKKIFLSPRKKRPITLPSQSNQPKTNLPFLQILFLGAAPLFHLHPHQANQLCIHIARNHPGFVSYSGTNSRPRPNKTRMKQKTKREKLKKEKKNEGNRSLEQRARCFSSGPDMTIGRWGQRETHTLTHRYTRLKKKRKKKEKEEKRRKEKKIKT